MFFFFFFQAEDGIRDTSVTGVQTCALPILQVGTAVRNGPLCSRVPSLRAVSFTLAVALAILASASAHAQSQAQHVYRSEERRVGKECRSRLSTTHYKKER